MQKIIKSINLRKDIQTALEQLSYDQLFVLIDTNTEKLCLPLIAGIEVIDGAQKIIIPAGDNNKNINSLTFIWKYLSENGATRNSLIINLGGGMISDIGGFAAASFKRGIRCINIPTTLLGAIDAAVGGKTGINFNDLKNEIGAFAPAERVIIDATFFKTLDHTNFLSGYAELLKHSLINSTKDWAKAISFDTDTIDYKNLTDLVADSVAVKERIVEEDPFEKGIRKALNLGHTIGHAFESLSYIKKQPLQHGYAVAWGLICELYLSHKFCNFPTDKLRQTINFIKENYGNFQFDCDDYELLYNYMTHDKKNESNNKINFTLLEDIGKIKIDQTASKESIFESIDFLRESVGL